MQLADGLRIERKRFESRHAPKPANRLADA
jgi:hypothetical protein